MRDRKKLILRFGKISVYTVIVVAFLYSLGLFTVFAMDVITQGQETVDEQFEAAQQLKQGAEEMKIPKIDKVHPFYEYGGTLEWSNAYDSGTVQYSAKWTSLNGVTGVEFEAPTPKDRYMLSEHYKVFEQAAMDAMN